MADALLHVVVGTKAQYIKVAPVLRLLAERGIPHRLIDTGQHGRLTAGLRAELGINLPVHRLDGVSDVTRIGEAVGWAGRVLWHAGSRRHLRERVFADAPGLCLVHGDTPSTLLAVILARRAGLPVAHLEAGLRSRSLAHPFPEELIRRTVTRHSQLLLAPGPAPAAALRRLGVRGNVVEICGNTSMDAMRFALQREANGERSTGPAILTMHRVENLMNRRRVAAFVTLACRLASRHPTCVVLHPPTITALSRSKLFAPLASSGVELRALTPYREFVGLLASAPLVVTDGGSVQEECALLGVPTLLWRRRTERGDGIGANVVLSAFDPAVIDPFVDEPERWRTPAQLWEHSPSAQVVDALERELESGDRRGEAASVDGR